MPICYTVIGNKQERQVREIAFVPVCFVLI